MFKYSLFNLNKFKKRSVRVQDQCKLRYIIMYGNGKNSVLLHQSNTNIFLR